MAFSPWRHACNSTARLNRHDFESEAAGGVSPHGDRARWDRQRRVTLVRPRAVAASDADSAAGAGLRSLPSSSSGWLSGAGYPVFCSCQRCNASQCLQELSRSSTRKRLAAACQ